MIIFITSTVSDPDDRAFMIALYQRYARLMEETARRYVFKPEEREDVVQDSLVKLIQNIEKIRALPRCTLPSYIVSTIRNTAYDHLRSTGRQNAHQAEWNDDDASAILSAEPPLEEMLYLSEKKDALSQIWPKLSETDQILLKGKYLLGYSDQTLGQLLHCKPGSVRMKLTRARRRALQLILEQIGTEDDME